MSGLKAKGRSAVAVALVALFVFVPSPARADASGWWWLPPAWAALISGALDVGVDVLTGRAENHAIDQGSGFQPTGEPVDLSDNRNGRSVFTPILHYFDQGGWPVFTMRWDYCERGSSPSAGNTYCGSSYTVDNRFDAVHARAPGGSENAIFRWNSALGAYSFNDSTPPVEATLVFEGFVGNSVYAAVVPTMFTRGDSGLSTTTTEIVCRDASGDFTVSETSAAGATVAPSPVCPPGSFPVRITVTNSVDGVLSDVSITAPDWYLADPSSVEFGFTVDGTICQAGNPACDDLVANPHHWDPYTNKCYARQRNLDLLTSLNVSYPAAIPGPGDGWIEVPDEMCLDRPDSALPPLPTAPETPEDQDLGVISRAIERVIESVKAVGSAVRSVGQRIAEGIAGFRSDMNEKIAGFRQDMKDGFDRVVEAIGGIGDSGDGDGDGDGEGSLPGDTGDLLGRAGDALGAPFEAWTDALGGIPAAFSVPASDCMGPAWTIPGGGTHYPFQTCTGQAQRVARVVYVMTGAAVALVGLLAVVRLLGAAIGVQVNSGASQE